MPGTSGTVRFSLCVWGCPGMPVTVLVKVTLSGVPGPLVAGTGAIPV